MTPRVSQKTGHTILLSTYYCPRQFFGFSSCVVLFLCFCSISLYGPLMCSCIMCVSVCRPIVYRYSLLYNCTSLYICMWLPVGVINDDDDDDDRRRHGFGIGIEGTKFGAKCRKKLRCPNFVLCPATGTAGHITTGNTESVNRT